MTQEPGVMRSHFKEMNLFGVRRSHSIEMSHFKEQELVCPKGTSPTVSAAALESTDSPSAKERGLRQGGPRVTRHRSVRDVTRRVMSSVASHHVPRQVAVGPPAPLGPGVCPDLWQRELHGLAAAAIPQASSRPPSKLSPSFTEFKLLL